MCEAPPTKASKGVSGGMRMVHVVEGCGVTVIVIVWGHRGKHVRGAMTLCDDVCRDIRKLVTRIKTKKMIGDRSLFSDEVMK